MISDWAPGMVTGGAEAVAAVALGAPVGIGADDASSAVAGAAAIGAVVGGCVNDTDVGASGDAAFGAAGRCRNEGHSSAATNITANVATPHFIADRTGVPGLAAAMTDDAMGAEL